MFLNGGFSRLPFFNFINETRSGELVDKLTEKNQSLTPEFVNGQPNPKVQEYHDTNERLGRNVTIFKDPNRRRIFDILMKISSDILFFLLSKPTINSIWWNVSESFNLVVMFMKNLAEGNNIAYKQWFSSYIPSSLFDAEFNKLVNYPDPNVKGTETVGQFSAMQFYICQMLYVSNFSMMSENNKWHVEKPTDQGPRIKALLEPIMDILNEFVTGPCVENQELVLAAPYLPLYNIYVRTFDDLSSEYFELQYSI
jgi:hypothetical protein